MKLGTKLTIAFVLGFLVIGGAGIRIYSQIQQFTASKDWVVHTHQVLEKLEHVQLMLTNAETGARGFVLTGDEQLLAPYNSSVAEVQKDVASVEYLTRDNPDQQRDLEQLQKLCGDKLEVLRDLVEHRRDGGLEAALPVIRTERGEQIMDDIRKLMNVMEQRENGLLEARNRAAGQVARQTALMLGFGALLSLAILGIAAVIVIRTMRLAERRMRLGGAGGKWPRIAVQYAFAAAVVALATGLKAWLEQHVGPMPIFVTFYPAVLLAATVAGGGPGIAATVLSALAANYWFIPPKALFAIEHGYDAVAMGIFAGTGIFLSLLAERLRRARVAEAVSAAQEQELALVNLGNLMTLDLNHRILRWSEGNGRLYGFTAGEAQGKLAYDLLHTEFHRPLEQIHADLLEKGRWEDEVTRRGKDGAVLSLTTQWVLRRDERGKPVDILVVSTDISRQKAAEDSLRQQSEELAQQNEELARQTEELTQQSEELSEQNEELARQSEEIQGLNTELGHREKTLQTLLDSARLPMGEQEVLAQVCQAALEMTGPGAEFAAVCELRGDELHILGHTGGDGAGVPKSWPVQGSFVEMMIGQDRTASLEDAALRPDLKLLSIAGRPRFGAVLAAPLRVQGKPVGGFSIYSSTKQPWTAEQFRLVEWLAAQCSNTLEAMRLQAEVREGQKLNDFLASILERASQPFGVGYPDGRLGLVNEAFEQLTGYTAEELRSMDWTQTLTPPEWRKIERLKLEELDRTGVPARYEKEYLRKDGSRVPIEALVHLAKDEQGKPLYYYSFLTDITERKRAETALRQSQKTFSELIERSPFGTYIIDSQFRIALMNASSQTGAFRNVRPVIGRPFTEAMHILWPAAVAEEIIGHFRHTLETGESFYSRDFIRPRHDAQAVEAYEWELHRMTLPDGQFGVICYYYDSTKLRQAEEALRQREKLLQDVIDGSTSPIFLKDLDGKFITINASLEMMLGTSRDKIKGKTDYDIAPKEAADRWRTNDQRVMATGKAIQIEESADLLDGHHVFLANKFPLVDANGQTYGVGSISHDITDRKRMEEALRESESKYRNLFENMTEEVHFWKLVRDGDGRIKTWTLVDANPPTLKSWGRKSVEEIRGKTTDEIFGPGAAEHYLPVVNKVMTEGVPHVYEDYFPNLDKHFRFTTVPLGDYFITTGADITGIMKAQEALQNTLQRFYTVLSSMYSGILLVSDAGKVEFANQSFCDMFGLKDAPADLAGISPDEVTAKIRETYRHPDEAFARIKEIVDRGQPVQGEELAVRGDRTWLRDFVPLNIDGKSYGRVWIHYDITERKRMEQRLLEMNESLEQRVAERTAEVRQQADHLRALAVELSQAEQRERKRLALILHDHVQQLLVAAQLQLGLVERGDPRNIRATVQGIHSTLSEAIAASRSLTVELSPPILHQSGLTAALAWLAAREEEKYLFKVHVRANSDAEPADPDVRALLFNSVQELLLNAVKHSGVREAELTMRRTRENWTQIIVEDKGKGFDPSLISAHRGGGFGLFSIQQRLAYVGGRLEVESAPGRGARFVLMIPVGEAAAKEAAAAAPPAELAHVRPKGSRISVLLVDDHRIVRQGLASLLEFEEDIEVVGEAEDGRQALELAHRHEPDVVIMDINMPVMNGIEATRILTKEMPHIKVIGLSMHSERDTAEAMRQAGATAYLTKGGPSEDLIAAIRACRR